MRDGAGLALLLSLVGKTAAAAPADLGGPVLAAADRLARTTAKLWAGGDPTVALANATAYLDAAGHLVIAWLWLEQLAAAADRTGDFYAGKRLAARYFITHELPRTGPLFDLLDSRDTLLVDLQDAWLG
jgi:hypothetical protein